MKKTTTLATILLFICSCNSNQEQSLPTFAPKVVEALGYVVPKDSMAAPKVIPAGKPRIVTAGKPKVLLLNTNVHPVRKPKVVIAGTPRVCTPGEDGFSLPKSKLAVGSRVMAGIPEQVVVKEAYANEQNPQSFSSFGRLQGLKNTVILCLGQDKARNLWFGSLGGGLTKYDGRSFSHFTEKEGLSNNWIKSIHEDRNGNLWFGMGHSVVSMYDGKSFTHFKVNETLDNTHVSSITEDKNGHLWFGTYGGVARYDGKSFTYFTEKEGLINDDVQCMLEDKSGNLWVGTRRGLSKYDGKNFVHFTEKEGLSNNLVLSILQDKTGSLWVGTDMGLNKYDGKTFTHFTEKEGLVNNIVSSIGEDKNGNLWFGTWGGGVSKYDFNSFTNFSTKAGLGNYAVFATLEDNSGNIWFGTQDGLHKYDPNVFTHFTEEEGMSNNNVCSILEDKNGKLWIGTLKNGVNRYDGKSFTHFTVTEGLIDRSIWSMLEDKSGNLWFGTYRGVAKYDGKSFTYFTEKEGLINNDVKCILEDQGGNIWFGTAFGVSKYDGQSFTQFTRKEGLKTDNVMSILEDKKGNLWFSSFQGGVSRYDGKSFTHFTKKEGLSHNHVRSILEDNNGNLWLGTLGGGVCKYDGNSFTHFTEKEGLSNNDVTSMLLDKSGNLWLGTRSGLNKLEKDKLALYTNARVRSPNNSTGKNSGNKAIQRQYTRADDSNGEAAFNMPKSEHLFKTYTVEDGFSGIGVASGKTICEARDGTIWIGTEEGLTAFHPGAETTDTIPPNIQLTGLALFNEIMPWQYFDKKTDTNLVLGNGMSVHGFHFDSLSKWYGVPQQLSLAHNNNYPSFQFVGITLQSPGKVKYQFMLEGLDKRWSALTDRTEAHYGNLPHGKYTFKVKAMNGDGYWSKELKYSFTIRPPWWHTWWAYTLVALLFVGFIYALFRYRLNKERMQHQITLQKQKASELEMQALRAQMNPHFIFNSLNAINMFILENNKLQASEYLAKFSKLVRLILQNSQEAFVPLQKELEALRLYLELESLRFEQKFLYTISINDEIDTTVLKVPPLIIQPYAENAIWHGLMHKKETGHLEIQLYKEENILYCKIFDDGIGRKKADELKTKSASVNKSMGMRITASRIARLQKNQNDVSIFITDLVLPDGTPGGTEVLLKIPVLS